MDRFTLMRNSLIEKTDNEAVESRNVLNPLKNTLKTVIEKKPLRNDTTIYNRKIHFDIPREYNNLAQLYVKCELTWDVSTTPESLLGCKIFKDIILRDKVTRTKLFHIKPEYSVLRTAQLYGTPLFDRISLGAEVGSITGGTPVTIFVPIYCFFSEGVDYFLKTRYLNPMELECIVNESSSDMGVGGLSQNLSSAEYSLFCLFFDTNEPSKLSDLPIINDIYPWKKIKGSYDVFYEDDKTCAIGSNEQTLLLRCPHPTFSINCSLINETSNKKGINSFELIVGGVTVVSINYKMNYTMFGNEISYLDQPDFSYFISKEKSRSVDSGLLVFNGSMSPAYIKVTYDTITEEENGPFILKTFCEYRTDFDVSEKGAINISTDRNIPEQYSNYKILQYPNSGTGPFYLNG